MIGALAGISAYTAVRLVQNGRKKNWFTRINPGEIILIQTVPVALCALVLWAFGWETAGWQAILLGYLLVGGVVHFFNRP